MRPSALLLIGLATACPARVEPTTSENLPATTPETDPRVIRDGEDLYVGGAPSAPSPPRSGPLGRGVPDETNGVCRLFSASLAEPKCCPELGFDAAKVTEICGHADYLGESVHGSCGYHFQPAGGGKAAVVRVSLTLNDSVADAAKQHDQELSRLLKDPFFKSKPVPNFDGALWSSAEGLTWTFIPGWSKPRLVTWNDQACPRERASEMLKLLAEAGEPPQGSKRQSLIPVPRSRAANH